ncbi:hypothetical protein C8F04DRAFT_976280, partial [Mycena alexandri]
IDRNLRVCRFCKAEIESPEHAMLECDAQPDLIALREDFFTRMRRDVSGLPEMDTMPPARYLTHLIAYRDTISLVAKFAYKVVQIFEATPMYIPPLPLHWLMLPRHKN